MKGILEPYMKIFESRTTPISVLGYPQETPEIITAMIFGKTVYAPQDLSYADMLLLAVSIFH